MKSSMEKPSGPSSSPQAPSPSMRFVQTDATTFKELVQRLTGPSDESLTQGPKFTGVKRTTFKLQERRHGSRSKLTIMRPNTPNIPLMGFSTPSPSPSLYENYLFSPSISPSTDFSGLKLSEKTGPSTSGLGLDEEAEEKAIKERRFYLHPSPQGFGPRNSEPELLSLFPLTSPSSKSTVS